MPEDEDEEEEPCSLDWARDQAVEVVNVSGTRGPRGIGESNDDRVVGEVPEEGGSWAAHADSYRELSYGPLYAPQHSLHSSAHDEE